MFRVERSTGPMPFRLVFHVEQSAWGRVINVPRRTIHGLSMPFRLVFHVEHCGARRSKSGQWLILLCLPTTRSRWISGPPNVPRRTFLSENRTPAICSTWNIRECVLGAVVARRASVPRGTPIVAADGMWRPLFEGSSGDLLGARDGRARNVPRGTLGSRGSRPSTGSNCST